MSLRPGSGSICSRIGKSSITRLADLIATTSDDQSLGDQTKAGLGSTDDVAAPPVGKVVKIGPALATGPASFMHQPGSRWAMMAGATVIVVAGIAYGVMTLRRQAPSVSALPTTGSPTQSVPPAVVASPTPAQQPANASKTVTSDTLRLDLVTDCDRLAGFPGDPDLPQNVPGVLASQIDIVAALTACNAVMRQYPDVARFIFQAGRIASLQKDYGQARELYEKAAAAGSKGALNGLGAIYQGGTGASQDYGKALSWYQKAAAAGVTFSFGNIGNIYFYGWGVPKDYAEARQWYEKGAAAGQPNAMSGLGSLYYNGYGILQDYAQARQWYEKAAAGEEPNAMNTLGWLYQNGLGVSQDYGEARQWYEKASAGGQPVAMANLGNLYSNGYGVPKDYAQARIWYEKAAAGGRTAAMINLGNLYFNGGYGVSKDYAQARMWYEKAAAAGDASASAMIQRIDASTQQSASVDPGSECGTVVGAWTWKYLDQTEIVTLKANGTGSATNGNTSTWTCGGRTVTINWSQGQVDKMTLSSDGKRMAGTGWRGISVLGIRM